MKKRLGFFIFLILVFSLSIISAVWWNPSTWFENSQTYFSSYTCSDSDGGINYYQKGVATLVNSHEDSCNSSSLLFETSCNGVIQKYNLFYLVDRVGENAGQEIAVVYKDADKVLASNPKLDVDILNYEYGPQELTMNTRIPFGGTLATLKIFGDVFLFTNTSSCDINDCNITVTNSEFVLSPYKGRLNYNIYNCSSEGKGCLNGACVDSSNEICDGWDNDFDGIVDEGNLCSGGLTCENGLCVQPNCNSVWVYHNTSCNESDVQIVWYEDTNCSVVRANETYDCDYNGLGIIGEVGDIQTQGISELKLGFNGRNFDSSKNYSDDEYEVEFLDEDENVLVSFDYNFEDDDAINLKNIYLEKQRSSSDFGYLIVNGLDEIEKTFWIDRINSESKYLCVKDSEVFDVDDISDSCIDSKEYLLRCPGISSGNKFRCELNNNYFIVFGLKNSGVKELVDFASDWVNSSELNNVSPDNCVSNWSCKWSRCIDGLKTYDCWDSNFCGTYENKPSENPTVCSTDSENETLNKNNSTDSMKQYIIYTIIFGFVVVVLLILIIFFSKGNH